MKDNDYKLLQYLLNGQTAHYRRPDLSQRRVPTEVSDPDELSDYDRLFFDEDPRRSKEDAALCSFHWCPYFSAEEARAWFESGAGYQDLRLCVQFKRAGVPPEVAARPLRKLGKNTGLTIFQAVATHVITPELVRGWMDESARRRDSEPA